MKKRPWWKFWQKANPVARELIGYLAGNPIWTKLDFANIAQEGYKRNAYAYAAIRKIAKSFSRIPVRAKRRAMKEKGKDETLDDHKILHLLRRPNPRTAGVTFEEVSITFLVYSGNLYMSAVPVMNGNRPPQELWAHRPDKMKIVPVKRFDGKDGRLVDFYKYGEGELATRLEEKFTLHIREVDPLDDWYGMGFMEPAGRSIDANNEAKKWNTAMLQNFARPSALVHYKEDLDDESWEMVKEELNFEELDVHERAKLRVTSGGEMQWEQIGLSPADMDWLKGTIQTGREIAIAADVAPELLGDSANKTYSNVQEAKLALYEDNIIPRKDLYVAELNNWLVPMFQDEGLYLEPDYLAVPVLRDRQFKLWDMAGEAFERGLINKGRTLEIMGEDADVEDKELLVMKSSLKVMGEEETDESESTDEEESAAA